MPPLTIVLCSRCGAPLGRGLPGATGVCAGCRATPPPRLPGEQEARRWTARRWWRLAAELERAGGEGRGA